MSGLTIAYPASPLTVRNGPDGSASPGERLTRVGAEDAATAGWIRLRRALREYRWHLLACSESFADDPGQPGSASPPSWVSSVALDDATDSWSAVRRTLGLTEGGWILVRPDGYVAARGSAHASLPGALDRLRALAGL
jgi:NADPH-dependent dioxygenase